MNTTSKVDLQALEINDIVETIIAARKVIGKHNHLKNDQNQTNALINKVKGFIAKFSNFFQNGLPSFRHGQEYFISQEYYQALFVHQRNEDSKFNDLEKHLKGHVIVDKLKDDFYLLCKFRMIVKNFPPPSYSKHNDMEVLTKEMVTYEYHIEIHWEKIVKLGNNL